MNPVVPGFVAMENAKFSPVMPKLFRLIGPSEMSSGGWRLLHASDALILSDFPVGQSFGASHWYGGFIWIRWSNAIASNRTSRNTKMCFNNRLIVSSVYLCVYITNHFTCRVMGIAIDRCDVAGFHQIESQSGCIPVNKRVDFGR